MKTIKQQKCKGHENGASTTRKVPSYSFFTYFYPPDSPEGKLNYFFSPHEVLVPKSVLFFTKEASECKYEDSTEAAQEAEDEEEDNNEEQEEGPERDLNPAEGSLGEPRYLCVALSTLT